MRAKLTRRSLWKWWLLAVLALSPHLGAQIVVLSEDFEGTFPGGWTVADDDPFGTSAYWGAADSAFGGEGAHSGTRKAYCAGSGFGGTTANPVYQSDMTASMSRSINLGGFSAVTLTFWFKIPSLETDVDLVRVLIDNTAVWTTNDIVGAWTQASINLNNFVGGVRTLKFEFVSDASLQFEGWYVDDILVTATEATGPANDNFANAFPISGASGTANGTTVGASKEAGEPNHAGNTGGKSAWYRWTPSSSGTVILDTVGSSFDTLLAVYAGTSVGSLSLVAQNDDIVTGSNPQSRVTFTVTAGTVYRIAVDGYNGDSGTAVLNWSEVSGPPPNDAFGSAILLAGAAGMTIGTNLTATKQSGEPNHAGNPGAASLWYRWTASVSGPVTFHTLGSGFDTLLGVYTGGSLNNLSVVASNDDISVNFVESQVSFSAVAGTTYRIAVDGFDGAIGTFQLNWSQAFPPNNPFAQATVLSGASGTAIGTNFNATLEPAEPLHAGEPGGHSVWYWWTAPANGVATFDTAGSALNTLLAVYTGNAVNSLSLVASNHYQGDSLSSTVTFPAIAGTVYRIAVDGFDGTQWTFKLNWSTELSPTRLPVRFTGIATSVSGQVQVTLEGNPGEHYEVEASTNLVHWSDLLSLTNASGTIQFNDPNAVGFRRRFYRARLRE
jgi:hypothetical protein